MGTFWFTEIFLLLWLVPGLVLLLKGYGLEAKGRRVFNIFPPKKASKTYRMNLLIVEVVGVIFLMVNTYILYAINIY